MIQQNNIHLLQNLQEKQTEIIKKKHRKKTHKQLKIKQKQLKSLSTPTIKDEDDVDSINSSFYTKSIEDEENCNIKSVDSEISDMVSALLKYDKTRAKTKFKKQNFNNY